MSEKQWEHEKDMATIQARQEMAEHSPYLFIVWDIGWRIISWGGTLALMALCVWSVK